LARLPDSVKRLTNADRYPVGLERQLHDLKQRMVRTGLDRWIPDAVASPGAIRSA